ncbi:mechanosensitive ion channel domain-containing protein [Candidatus Parabeggiatoa sp. HSG14]|uniref:mechanosensitive ion channel domain-containing protein n=1 Tax=Candidatus Parabeggiatoa sp. HSG14 TaxID=3055593 RepID=UPI0025A8B12F|nr:mechanosensitive ion channel [Thiotrichales bacterium HSG14]
MKERWLSILWIVLISLWFPLSVLSEVVQEEKAEAQALYKLNNEELIKQAQNVFNEAFNKFRTELRGVFTSEKRLKQAQQKSKTLVIPEEKPTLPSESISSLELAKITLNYAEIRLNTFKQWLKLIKTEKTLWEGFITRIETAQSSANIFMDRLNKLNSFLFEIELRIGDGTLLHNEVPDLLDTKKIESQKQESVIQQNELKMKMNLAQEALDKVISRFQEIENNIIETEVDYSSAQKKYSQELKWQELESQYSKQTPERLLAQLAELQEEQVWLNGTYNLSRAKFSRHQISVSQIEKSLEELSPPKTTKLQITHAEEIEQASKIAEEVTTYHTARIKKLEQLQSQLESLIKSGESLEGDATVLNGHIFKIKVIAKILENLITEEKITADSIPENSRFDAIVAVGHTISKQVSEALAATEKAKKQFEQLVEKIEKSKTARKEVNEKLANLKKVYQSAQQTQQWEAKLKELSAKQVIQDFKETSKKLQKNQETLQETQKEFQQAQTTAEEVKLSLESLKAPLLRSAQKESLPEKSNILKTLYKFAELDLPEDEKTQTLSAKISIKKSEENVDGSNKSEASDKSKASDKSTQENKKAPTSSKIEVYQNLLSTRIRIIEEKKTHRVELLKALNALSKEIEQYASILSETRQLALQHHTNAVELKKRLGRGQLSNNEIPEGVTDALKSERITHLNTGTNELLTYQADVQQQIASISNDDETLKETGKSLAETKNLVGKRLDILEDLQKLAQQFERKQDALSETQLKTLQQTAIRRMEYEDNMAEFLVSFVPSERAKNLTELLQGYYLELTELENKQDNLQGQIDKTERLIQLAEEEKLIIVKLVSLLQKQKGQLETTKEKEWVKIKIQLMPQRAEEILGNYEKKTGHSLTMPVLISEKYQVDAINKATHKLFDNHVQIKATDKWISLFKQRLSSSGIDVEIGEYQDKAGVVNAKNSAIQRRVQHITGHSPNELAKLSSDEKPKAETDKRHFLAGEIGVLRADRYKTRTHEALQVFIKLASIFLVAIFLIWLINYIIDRVQNSKTEKNAQTLFVLSFLKGFLKIAIWVFAIITVFSTLGFQIGAILAGLGIGGLAVAMAAKETLANVLGGITIFIERSFAIGDVIKVGSSSAQKVVHMTWRSTRLLDPFGYYTSIPNRIVAESTLQNYTKSSPTWDYITVYVSPQHEPHKVMSLIDQALAECQSILQDQSKGTRIAGVKIFDSTTAMGFWPWWHTSDYHDRYNTRQDVWYCIWKHLSGAGIDLKIEPSDLDIAENLTVPKALPDMQL